MTTFFDKTLLGDHRSALEFIEDVLESSTEYSIIGQDLEGTILLWNEGARRLYGYEPDEVIGKLNSTILYAVEDVEAGVPAEITEATLREGRWEGTIVRRGKDDRRFTARVVITVRRATDGTAIGFLIISKDISDEIQLQRSEERFRSLVESAPDGILGVTEDGRILLVNAQAERMFGYTRETLIGRSVELLLPDSLREALVRLRATFAADPSPRLMSPDREVNARRQDGSIFPASVNLSALQLDEGRMIVAAARDISELRRAEKDRGVLEGQLHQAQRMESIGQLAGGIAHDFNNLLMVISNYAEWALEQLVDNEPVRKDVEEIRKAADRAAALTHQLLIFSRREQAEPKIIDLNATIAGMQEMLGRTLGEHISFQTRADPEPCSVEIDPGQLEQVIVNLALNARDAMAEGGTLLVEAGPASLDDRSEDRDGMDRQYVHLRVTDDGHGMDAAVRDRIFEPFFTTKPRGRGTGLGMSTVYGVVTEAGGKVQIDSTPGKGTTVTVLLPLVTSAVSTKPPSPIPRGGGGEHILLVEDEDGVREIASRVLMANGYTVTAASTPADALERLQRDDTPLDLLLTDVVMPGISGRELADEIRLSRPELPVIFMSGYPSDYLSKDVSTLGDVRLRKPFGQATLLGAVRDSLDSARARRSVVTGV